MEEKMLSKGMKIQFIYSSRYKRGESILTDQSRGNDVALRNYKSTYNQIANVQKFILQTKISAWRPQKN
jgi:hypothetical protein